MSAYVRNIFIFRAVFRLRRSTVWNNACERRQSSVSLTSFRAFEPSAPGKTETKLQLRGFFLKKGKMKVKRVSTCTEFA